ncbi:hypothetical protein U1Q18_024931 [Sarracenia purpurea var. burkii]
MGETHLVLVRTRVNRRIGLWSKTKGFSFSLPCYGDFLVKVLGLPIRLSSFKSTIVNKDKNKNDHGEEKTTMDPNRPPISLFQNSNRMSFEAKGRIRRYRSDLKKSAARRTSSAKVAGLVGAELLTARAELLPAR